MCDTKITGYKKTIGKTLEKKLKEIIQDFLSKLNFDSFCCGFPVYIKNKKGESEEIREFIKNNETRKVDDNYIRIKFSSLYNYTIDNKSKIIKLHGSQNKKGIYWNIDEKMLDNKKVKLTDETIHSEVSLISDIYNYSYENIIKEDLVFITSSRPCKNCSNTIQSFNNRIKIEGLKGIKHILLGKNDLYIGTEFLITLKNLLDSGIRVFIYTLKGYNETSGCKLFYDILLNRDVKIDINNIEISELSYQHIEEINKKFEKGINY